jgi:hypothetical protein
VSKFATMGLRGAVAHGLGTFAFEAGGAAAGAAIAHHYGLDPLMGASLGMAGGGIAGALNPRAVNAVGRGVISGGEATGRFAQNFNRDFTIAEMLARWQRGPSVDTNVILMFGVGTGPGVARRFRDAAKLGRFLRGTEDILKAEYAAAKSLPNFRDMLANPKGFGKYVAKNVEDPIASLAAKIGIEIDPEKPAQLVPGLIEKQIIVDYYLPRQHAGVEITLEDIVEKLWLASTHKQTQIPGYFLAKLPPIIITPH